VPCHDEAYALLLYGDQKNRIKPILQEFRHMT